MFLRRIRLPLVGKHLKTAYQAHTGYGRIDHLVHVAQLGSPVRVGKLAAIVILQLFTPGFGVAALSISLRKRMFTAPSGPITAISAVG